MRGGGVKADTVTANKFIGDLEGNVDWGNVNNIPENLTWETINIGRAGTLYYITFPDYGSLDAPISYEVKFVNGSIVKLTFSGYFGGGYYRGDIIKMNSMEYPTDITVSQSSTYSDGVTMIYPMYGITASSDIALYGTLYRRI